MMPAVLAVTVIMTLFVVIPAAAVVVMAVLVVVRAQFVIRVVVRLVIRIVPVRIHRNGS